MSSPGGTISLLAKLTVDIVLPCCGDSSITSFTIVIFPGLCACSAGSFIITETVLLSLLADGLVVVPRYPNLGVDLVGDEVLLSANDERCTVLCEDILRMLVSGRPAFWLETDPNGDVGGLSLLDNSASAWIRLEMPEDTFCLFAKDPDLS